MNNQSTSPKRVALLGTALLPLLALLVGSLAEAPQAKPMMAFDAWSRACEALPSGRREDRSYPARDQLPLKTFAEFEKPLVDYFNLCLTGHLAAPDHWLGERPGRETFFNPRRSYTRERAMPFQPFAQRLQLPPGARVILQGDLHGDVRSLVAGLKELNRRGILQGFKLADANTHMLFLGDYTDRGIHGVEVLYTILRLKLANPEQVWMIRGNHEDLNLVRKYGFAHEGQYKYGKDFSLPKVIRLYDFLPAVLYLGCGDDFVQCNHGGLEPGYNPSHLLAADSPKAYELLGELKRADFLEARPELIDKITDDDSRLGYQIRYQRNFRPAGPSYPVPIGFFWSDYALQGHESALIWDKTRPGWVWGREGTKIVLDTASEKGPKVRAIFRAHQHALEGNPMMRRLIAGKGVFRHWQEADSEELLEGTVAMLEETLESETNRAVVDGAVYTLNVSPDSLYGLRCDYDFHSFAILQVAETFADWRFEVVNVSPAP